MNCTRLGPRPDDADTGVFVRHGIALLFIGFSGLDTHVMELLRHASRVKRIGIVNGKHDDAERLFARVSPLLQDAGIGSLLSVDCIYDYGFRDFVGLGRLHEFVSVAA